MRSIERVCLVHSSLEWQLFVVSFLTVSALFSPNLQISYLVHLWAYSLLICDCNILLFLELWNRKLQEEVNRVENHVMSDIRSGTTKGVILF